MKYYHVSFDTVIEKKFTPRVPQVKSLPEDQTIPRICFAPSVGQYFQALPYAARDYIKKGARFVIFEIDSSEFEEGCWVSNEDLIKFNFVFDVVETGEIWITKPIKLTGKLCELDNFTCEPDLLFSRLEPKDVVDTALVIEPSIDFVDIDADAKSTYNKLMRYAEEKGFYSILDDLFEELGTKFEYIQTWRFNNVIYHCIDDSLSPTSLFE